MKILHIIFSFTIGGTENMLVDIANEQIKENDVTIIVINNLIDERLVKLLSPQIKIIPLFRNPRSFYDLLKLVKLKLLCLWLKPDLIHLHNARAIKLFPRIVTRKNTIIFTAHTTGILLPSNGMNVDKVFAISQAVADDLYQRHQIKAIVIPNGVVVNSIQSRDHFEVPSQFKLVQVGRLQVDVKGQDLLIKAIHSLVHKHKINNIIVDFIGDGPSFKELKQLTEDLLLQDFVNFLGSMSKDQIYEKLPNYDLLVQPSRIEGFGLTIVEGMLAKIPVLTSDIAGPMEVIQDGKFGYAFKNEDVIDLSHQIIHVIEDYKNLKIQNRVLQAYEHVSESYSIKRVAQDYIQLSFQDKL